MKRRIVLNIGWARAGSTALRRNFLSTHRDIALCWRGQDPHQSPAALTLDLLKAAEDRAFLSRLPELQDRWHAFAQRTRAPIVLSDEELSIGLPGGLRPERIAERCARLFPDARLLAVLRDRTEAVRSFYALAQRPIFADPMPFATWLDRYFLSPAPGCDFTYLYAYANTLRAYQAGRDREDLLCLDHAGLRCDPHEAYRKIARWLGISPAACTSLPMALVNASPPMRADWAPSRMAALRASYDADERRLRADFGISIDPLEGAAVGDGI
jgi:hypothetical protein